MESLGIPVIVGDFFPPHSPPLFLHTLQVDLPAVGTNLQDHVLVPSTYLPNTPIVNSSNPNTPTTLAASFITLPQILGKSGADLYVRELNSTISERAAAIVASGAAVSRIGLEKIFTAQAMQFGEQDGTCLSLFWFKVLLNDESVAPVVEIIYLTGTDQVLAMVAWILVPQ